MPYPVNKALASKKDQRGEGSRRSLSAMIVSMLSSAPLTAVLLIASSIVVTVFAINQLLRHFCGTTKTVAVIALAVLPTVSAKSLLTKLDRWSFPMGVTGAALIIAAAAYATPYLVAAIYYPSSSGACAPIAGGIIASSAVAVAGVVATLGI